MSEKPKQLLLATINQCSEIRGKKENIMYHSFPLNNNTETKNINIIRISDIQLHVWYNVINIW